MKKFIEIDARTGRAGLLGTAICAASLIVAGSLHAATSGSNAEEGKPADAEPSETEISVQELALAQQLALYAQENGDAVAAIAAAGIASRAGVSEADGTVRGDTEAADFPTGPDEMLELARELSEGRRDLEGLIDDAEAASSRGSSQPGCYSPVQLGGNGNRVYDDFFYGSERARVELTGSGNSDVDLYVYDEYGNEICRSTSTGAFESCTWTPAWSGPFQLRVRNYGSRTTVAQVCTN